MRSQVPFHPLAQRHGLISSRTPVFFEPTSNQKALQLLRALEKADPSLLRSLPATSALVQYCAPNIHELSHLYEHATASEYDLYSARDWFDAYTVSAQDLAVRLPKWVLEEGVAQMAIRLVSTSIFGTLFVKSGDRGVLAVQRVTDPAAVRDWRQQSSAAGPKGTKAAVVRNTRGDEAIILKHYESNRLDPTELRNVTGAGDNLAGALLAGIARGLEPQSPADLDRLIDLAQRYVCGGRAVLKQPIADSLPMQRGGQHAQERRGGRGPLRLAISASESRVGEPDDSIHAFLSRLLSVGDMIKLVSKREVEKRYKGETRISSQQENRSQGPIQTTLSRPSCASGTRARQEGLLLRRHRVELFRLLLVGSVHDSRRRGRQNGAVSFPLPLPAPRPGCTRRPSRRTARAGRFGRDKGGRGDRR